MPVLRSMQRSIVMLQVTPYGGLKVNFSLTLKFN